MTAAGGSVDINLDFYKPYHPRYARLRTENDRTAGAYTSIDGRTWMAKAEAYAIEHRLDVVMETAMRQPSEFAEPAARFHAAGYRVEVAILAVPAALSRLGVLARYWQEAQRYGHGRLINNAVHDACYHGVLNGARDIDRDNIHVDVVTVFRRGNDALHTDWRRQDGQWIRQPQAAKTIRHERSRSWSPQETAVFASAMARLRSVMGPTWTSQLDEIEDLARPLQSQEPPRTLPARTPTTPQPTGPAGPLELGMD